MRFRDGLALCHEMSTFGDSTVTRFFALSAVMIEAEISICILYYFVFVVFIFVAVVAVVVVVVDENLTFSSIVAVLKSNLVMQLSQAFYLE